MAFANKKTWERKKSDEFRNLDFTRKVISLLDPKLPWSIHRSQGFCLFGYCRVQITLFFFFLTFSLIFSFIFISWRLITLQYCSGFVIHWHESAMDLHVFPIPVPPPTSLSTWSLWVFPVHQAWALVYCIPPGLVICFTTDNIHAVLSKHPTLAFSHRVQNSVLYICVSFFVLHIGLSLLSF